MREWGNKDSYEHHQEALTGHWRQGGHWRKHPWSKRVSLMFLATKNGKLNCIGHKELISW